MLASAVPADAGADVEAEALLASVRKFKYNSTSSIMTTRSTLALPKARELLLCVATVIHCQLLADDADTAGEDAAAVVCVDVGDDVPGNIFNESVILRYDPMRLREEREHKRAVRREARHRAEYERDRASAAATAAKAPVRAPVTGAFVPSLRSVPQQLHAQYNIEIEDLHALCEPASEHAVDVAATAAAPAESTDAAPAAAAPPQAGRVVRTGTQARARARAPVTLEVEGPSAAAAGAAPGGPLPGTHEFLYQLYVAQALSLASKGAARAARGHVSSSSDDDDDADVSSGSSGRILSSPPSHTRTYVTVPTLSEVYDFITALFTTAKFSPQCAVICVIYINRLVATHGIALHAGNWRPLVLTSLVLSQKVWDDKCLSVTDFALICPLFSPAQLERLEREFLRLLSFSLSVSQSLFAKYYLQLRELSEEVALARFGSALPLSAVEARKLEMRSREGRRLPSLAHLFSHGGGDADAGGDGRLAPLPDDAHAKGSAFVSYSEGVPPPARATGGTGATGGRTGGSRPTGGGGRHRDALPRTRDLEGATYAASPSQSRFVIS